MDDYIIITSDNLKTKVSRNVAIQSSTFRDLITDVTDDVEISLKKCESFISKKTLEKCIDFIEKSIKDPIRESSEYIYNDWALHFCDEIPYKELEELAELANYIEIKPLLDLITTKYANDIHKTKTLDEIRDIFGVKNDFDPDDYATYIHQCDWCLENCDKIPIKK
jgi:S-phase kinase-associated protein 1